MEYPTTSRKKIQYRNYLRSSSNPIPRSSLWRHRKRGIICALSSSNRNLAALSISPLPGPSDLSFNNNSLENIPPSTTISSVDPSIAHSSDDIPIDSPDPLNVDDYPSSPHFSPLISPILDGRPSRSLSPDTTSSPSASQSSSVSRQTSPSSIPSDDDTISDLSGSDSSSQSNFLCDENLFDPLYPDASITLAGALCAVMKFCIANNLTYTAINELLKLLCILCPQASRLPNSFYKFKKFFQQFSEIDGHQEVCTKCNQTACLCEVQSSHHMAHVVHLSIQRPLESILSRNWNEIVEPREKSKSLCDVWNGAALRPLCAPSRFFSDKHHMALCLSTDGVPLYKSSTVSIWPVYLVILNLPPSIRMNSENTILCGLWIGPSKPDMNILLSPISKYLRQLSTRGVKIKTTSGEYNILGKLVMSVFDLPAKAIVLNSKQYNGKYGCSVCLHPGVRLPNNSRIYPPSQEYEERTHSNVLACAKMAERENCSVLGVYGMSPLASNLDLVNCIPIDYMHNVLEGVTRWLLKAWFDSKHHAEAYYIGRHIRTIDKELLKQKPPKEFTRAPRSLSKHLKYWKASELRYWLLYYSLPLLLGKLPPLYWHHYSLLVCAIHVLLSEQISLSQVDAAELMLKDFYNLMPSLYGDNSCTANSHLLSHLPKYVRLWGPLWTHSSFGFESKNGHLKHLFHGKNNIFHQLLFNVKVSYTLQLVHNKLVECESRQTLDYIDKATPRSNMVNIGTHIYAVGRQEVIELDEEHSDLLQGNGNATVFLRMFKNGVMYYSTQFGSSECSKRDNTHCSYTNEIGETCFGQIEQFVCSPGLFAFVRKIEPLETSLISNAGHPCRDILMKYVTVDILSSYVIPIDLSADSSLKLIPLHCIVSKPVIISVSGKCYCIVQPNTIERH